jgi:hypothetical protein
MKKQSVTIGVPDGASDACVRLGVGLDTLCAVGLHVVLQATREGRTTVATTAPSFFGPIVMTNMDLQQIAQAINTPTPGPDEPPTV